MNPLIMIACHRGTEETVARHLPLWEAHGYPIWIVSPVDAPVALPRKHRTLHVGLSARESPKSALRMSCFLSYFLDSKHNALALFEYDSLCLKPGSFAIPRNVLTGCYHAGKGKDDPHKQPQWLEKESYVQAPWLLDRRTAERMLAIDRHYHELRNIGAADRYITALAHAALVPIKDHKGGSLGENTLGEDHMPEVEKRIKQGAVWYHGIKHRWVLERMLKVYDGGILQRRDAQESAAMPSMRKAREI